MTIEELQKEALWCVIELSAARRHMNDCEAALENSLNVFFKAKYGVWIGGTVEIKYKGSWRKARLDRFVSLGFECKPSIYTRLIRKDGMPALNSCYSQAPHWRCCAEAGA